MLKAGEGSNRLLPEFAERNCGAVAVEVIAKPPTPGPAIRGTMSLPNLVSPVTRIHKNSKVPITLALRRSIVPLIARSRMTGRAINLPERASHSLKTK